MEKELNSNENFDLNNPTDENIRYAFDNLVFNINASTSINVYFKFHSELAAILNKIDNLYQLYKNNNTLSVIDDKTLIDIREALIKLSDSTKDLEPGYIRWSLYWIDSIITLKIEEAELKTEIRK